MSKRGNNINNPGARSNEEDGSNVCNNITDIVDQGDLLQWSCLAEAYDHDPALNVAFSSETDIVDTTINEESIRSTADYVSDHLIVHREAHLSMIINGHQQLLTEAYITQMQQQQQQQDPSSAMPNMTTAAVSHMQSQGQSLSNGQEKQHHYLPSIHDNVLNKPLQIMNQQQQKNPSSHFISNQSLSMQQSDQIISPSVINRSSARTISVPRSDNDITNNSHLIPLSWSLKGEIVSSTSTNDNPSSCCNSSLYDQLQQQYYHSELQQHLEDQKERSSSNAANYIATERISTTFCSPLLSTSNSVAALHHPHNTTVPNMINQHNYNFGTVYLNNNIIPTHVPPPFHHGQVLPVPPSTIEEQLRNWIVEIQHTITPPYKVSGKKQLLLIPLTTYNYYFRDERDNIISNMKDGTDPLPSPVSHFTLSKMQALLYQRWYVDPMKKKRIHRKTHSVMDFKALSKVIAERWKLLDKAGRNFYDILAKYDDIYYHEQLAIIKASNMEAK